ncbi:hypothetical protein N8T08_001711 [Aspergillus melleus]|uniref:Uncharacterized protein n=1 Tax=Aspergillus melleus TaxID=138277 RepID=A0ACC3AN70_9EURO|nr:hypothetical protein N8T08_001711 [Aspergillus melleus]
MRLNDFCTLTFTAWQTNTSAPPTLLRVRVLPLQLNACRQRKIRDKLTTDILQYQSLKCTT